MKQKRTTILYVEDDEDDREFLSDAVKKADPAVDIIIAADGQQAMDYLNKLDHEVKHPSLIVLDINLPFIDGKEVFKKIRQNSFLNAIPIIVFSSGEHPADKALFNELGIEYIIKPTRVSNMGEIANHMLDVATAR